MRKLDGDMHVVAEQPQLRQYPVNLWEVITCVKDAANPPDGQIAQARAIGSHWCISKAGVTKGFMIESATPVHESDGDQVPLRLNNVLYEVIPHCMTAEAKRFFTYQQTVHPFNSALPPSHSEIYLFHVESGMRIHELYSRIDTVDELSEPRSLASYVKDQNVPNHYGGPWALQTMGGAGGQTIVGAMSTATHGGDQAFGPLSDSVVALHLINAQGNQHWIERTRLRPTMLPLKLVDEDRLREVYGNIEYHRDDDLMNAVTVACGRMGFIYSVVLRVVRQYALHESTFVQDWGTVRKWVTNKFDPVFTGNRFVKIDINPYGGFWHPDTNDCYVVTRVMKELDFAGKEPLGRLERASANAGKNRPLGTGDGYFDKLCASDNYIRLALDELQSMMEDLREKAIKVWLACAAGIVFPLTPPPVKAALLGIQGKAAATIVFTTSYIATIGIIKGIIGSSKASFSSTVASVVNFCARFHFFPILRFVFGKMYECAHKYDPEFPRPPAISYAAMDEHDYQNVSCVAPGDSIEIFFDAESPQLVDFIDLALQRVDELSDELLHSKAFGGYISLRFMSQCEAFIGMQKWPRTCSIEIAGLSKVDGTEPFLNQLEEDVKAFDAVLHWGQRNNWPQQEIEKRFIPAGPWGQLYRWREALSKLTEHGRYDLFSTPFSKHTGLEITHSIIGIFSAAPTEGCIHEKTNVTWDCIKNPPETQAFLLHTPENGSSARIPLPGLSGSTQVAFANGRSRLTLVLEHKLNDDLYVDTRDLPLKGFAPGNEWPFSFTAESRVIDGVARWYVEINLFNQFISNTLLVAEVYSLFAGVASWKMRNPDIGDVSFTASQTTRATPQHPVFNKRWVFFSDSPSTGPAPAVSIKFKLTCQH